jgi:membrane dipeptidase
MLLVDAHLDLAYNALRGRQVLLPARQQTPDNEGIPSVGLPDLREGSVGLICATIFCAPDAPNDPGYKNAGEAYEMAGQQLGWYRRQFDDGQMRLVRTRADLPIGPDAANISAIMLLEGADPIRTPADMAWFFEAGVRIVGLAWRQTRYAGGTGAPGPLTAEGIRLAKELDRFGIIHDASHLAEASFWQLLDLSPGKIIASHSNCRSIVPTDRQLSDAMIRAIAGRDGVLGINFYDRFLIPPIEYGKRRATLADVVTHMRHMCDVIGDDRHVGIGTDMDGGLGREQIPQEIETSADLPRLADALSGAGFDDAAVENVLGENWRRFFAQALP